MALMGPGKVRLGEFWRNECPGSSLITRTYIFLKRMPPICFQIRGARRFVFAAVKGDYGEKLLTKLDYVVLIEVPKETRMERVKMRSAKKFGDRIQEHGDLADKENSWFSVVNSRPENFVTEWLERVPCPVIRIDGTAPVEENVNYLLRKLLTYDIQVRRFKEEDAKEIRSLVARNFLEVNSKDYGLAAMEKIVKAEKYEYNKVDHKNDIG